MGMPVGEQSSSRARARRARRVVLRGVRALLAGRVPTRVPGAPSSPRAGAPDPRPAAAPCRAGGPAQVGQRRGRRGLRHVRSAPPARHGGSRDDVPAGGLQLSGHARRAAQRRARRQRPRAAPRAARGARPRGCARRLLRPLSPARGRRLSAGARRGLPRRALATAFLRSGSCRRRRARPSGSSSSRVATPASARATCARSSAGRARSRRPGLTCAGGRSRRPAAPRCCLYALIALAAEFELDLWAPSAVTDAYFPWIGALHSLLDSVVDAGTRIAATGQHTA